MKLASLVNATLHAAAGILIACCFLGPGLGGPGHAAISSLASAGAPTEGEASATPPGDLSGVWILDPALSRAGERRERGFGGPDRRGDERPPRARAGDDPEGDGDAGGPDPRERFRRMRILQSGDDLTITYGDGAVVHLVVGGTPTELGEGAVASRIEATRSEEGDLVLRTARDRVVTTETYVITHDRKLLTVLVSSRGPRGDLSTRRVYRPVEEVPGAVEP